MAHGPKAATNRVIQHDEEERMRLLVESIRDYAIFLLDSTGQITSWNSGAQIIKGYRADEIIGRDVSTFYTAEDRSAGRPRQLLETAAREGRVEVEGWRVRKDGTRFWADVVITALRGPNRELLGFVKVTRDLTEMVRAQEERLRLAHAEEAIRLRDEFLSIASHELKTPLTALQLQLESLTEQSTDLTPRMAAKLAGAARSSQRLSFLIDSLLDVSRIAAGHIQLQRAPIDLVLTTERLLESLGDAAAKAGSEVLLTGADSLMGEWDELRIDQLLLNLVSNGLKYGAGRPVEVSLARDGDQAVLAVRDHGPGIIFGDEERIFERFERATSVRHYGGFGLGLYVAREIARAHGGTIAVHNEPGGGACFIVRLPLTPPEEGA